MSRSVKELRAKQAEDARVAKYREKGIGVDEAIVQMYTPNKKAKKRQKAFRAQFGVKGKYD